MNADKMRAITSEKLAEQAEIDKIKAEEEAKKQKVWDDAKPLRIKLYYNDVIRKIKQEAEKGKNSWSDWDLGYPDEMKEMLEKDGFKVEIRIEQVEGWANYDTGAGNGIFHNEYRATVTW